MHDLDAAVMSMTMMHSADTLGDYSVSLYPWIKESSKRQKLFTRAQKNSEMYIQKTDNVSERVTMESIFANLTKGIKSGGG